MFKAVSHGRLLALCLAGATCFASSTVAEVDEDKVVKNLHYGETLYHFYQGKYFSAISDLLIAQKQHPIKTQGNDPDILLGGLYLSYDLRKYAADMFSKLTESDADKSVKDTAWYYLARLAYQKGNYAAAKKYISKVDVNLPVRYNDESQNLAANILLSLKDYQGAINTLTNFEDETEWFNYAKFNLAIALVKTGEHEDAMDLLEEVASMDVETLEQTALRDKANLSLGYVALRAKDAPKAAKYFKNIRLLGSQSNKALLGIGWAHHNNKDFQDSLVPWLELQKRISTDPSVQEAMITVPYTLEKMDAKQQALAYYNHAINTYNAELTNINNVINAVETGEFTAALRTLHSHQRSENKTHFTTLPESVATPYLHQIIAGHEFQAALKNYRDLLYMQNMLHYWKNQIPAYNLMLEERKKAYQDKLGTARRSLKQAERKNLTGQYHALTQKLEQINRDHDVLALATEKEKELLSIIATAKKRVAKMPADEVNAQKNRLRLF
ncbi:MAG: tetratricopeptide repeat protein, partial [Gammaproteobacteria bacterium]|nr:tetratricopeptide repeat protein [Gammaproteobacteria bacterium]